MFFNFHDDALDGVFTDVLGNTIERPEITHPYNFSSHATWAHPSHSDPIPEGFDRIHEYTDRILSQDYNKNNDICKKVFGNIGQYWDNRSPSDVERFLRLYHGNDSIKLLVIYKHCNQASGYPIWSFSYIWKN